MTKTEFGTLVDSCLSVLSTLLKKKNSDYNGDDVLATFNNGIAEPHIGIAIRMSDKMQRFKTLLKSANQVKDESILDTVKDLAGYCVLFLIVYTVNKKSKK